MRNRKLAELEPVECFDPQGKGSDREGPRSLLPISTHELPRRANPATRPRSAIGCTQRGSEWVEETRLAKRGKPPERWTALKTVSPDCKVKAT